MTKPWWQSKTVAGLALFLLTAALQHLHIIDGSQADMAYKAALTLAGVGAAHKLERIASAGEVAVTAP